MDQRVPDFDEKFPAMQLFLCELVEEFRSGRLSTWDGLEDRVNGFFTPVRMEQMESALPGWQKMASYLEGVTLTHVVCVFLGLYMLPEFSRLTQPQQNLMKWTVLLHDLEKEIARGKRHPAHAFHSAATAAQRLPRLGFPVNEAYTRLIDSWSQTTLAATWQPEQDSEPIQDNSRLPQILSGIDAMFGANTPGARIVKIVLLHMSVNVVADWPQAAPLMVDEITHYVDRDLLPLLKVMMLSDNEGWTLFYPERAQQRSDTLEAFEELEKRIS